MGPRRDLRSKVESYHTEKVTSRDPLFGRGLLWHSIEALGNGWEVREQPVYLP